jgi:hypothetical protein
MNADAQALQLRDIRLPGDPSWWPPAPGWWILGAAFAALVIWAAVLAVRRYRIARQRGRVLAMLARLEAGFAQEVSPEGLARISAMLRRLALTRFPRQRVAALSGVAWLRFLDESGGDGRFVRGPGRVLASGPYQRTLPADVDIVALTALIREWVARNAGSVR